MTSTIVTRRPRHRSRKTFALGAALCVAAFAAVQAITVTSAAAAPLTGLERTDYPSEFDIEEAKSAEARCPAPKKVIGGGGRISGSNSTRIAIERMVPSNSGAYFRVEAQAPPNENLGSWRVTAYAVCADVPQSAEYQVVTEPSSNADSAAFKHAEAGCPAGKRVIGGGASLLNGGEGGRIGIQLTRAAGPLDIWRGTAHENAGGHPGNWRVQSHAICIRPIGATVADGFGPRSAVARCTGDVHSVGGGGAPLRDDRTALLRAVEPAADLKSGSAEFNGTYPGGVVAQVVCA